MTIKQQGGIFGRNPTFNDVEVEGDLTLSGSLSLPNDSVSGDAIDGGNATLEGLTVGDTSRSFTGVFIVSSTTGESELRMGDTDTDAGSIAYRNDTNEMTFRTNAAPRATLDGSGNFEPTGNVVLANGKGIDFSATSGTGTSELFDDYEEGTWTPTYEASGGGGSFTTLTYSDQHGKYTKIGNVVYIEAFVRLSALDTTGFTGYLLIGGLPYSAASDNTNAVFRADSQQGWSNAPLGGNIGTGTSIVLSQIAKGDAQYSTIGAADMLNGGINRIFLSGCYITS